MLSILPYEHSQKETERPFKAYSRNSSSIPSSIYGPFAPTNMMSSMMGTVSQGSHNNLDLRPQMQYAASNLLDMSASLPGRIGFGGMNGKYDMSTTGMNGNMSAYNTSGMQNSFLGKTNGYVNVQPEMNHSPVPHHSSVPPLSDTRNGMNNSPIPETQTHIENVDTESIKTKVDEPQENFKVPPKKRPHAVPEELKDETYWDKRKKNNESAKRSRDARRMKEEQIAMRVVYLEQDNLQLRTEVSLLKGEIEKLRCMLYNS